jgi:GT2 family glycosyltransferase
MRCPQVNDLPSPPPGKTGWPWTEETAPRPSPAGQLWPKISIVTPSFNQGPFLEETIRSVLLQGYQDLEYIIIDGGSSDESVEIIRKYGSWLAYWISESDRGQSHAINKGWEKATGEIWAWLNSDDVYLRNALNRIAQAFAGEPQLKMIYGDSVIIDNQDQVHGHLRARDFSLEELLETNFIPQPSTFLKASALAEVGGLNESLHLCMDYSLWLQVAQQGDVSYIGKTLSAMRLHPESKTCTALVQMNAELADILNSFLEAQSLPDNLRTRRHEIAARQNLVAGAMLWFNGEVRQATKYVETGLIGCASLDREDVAIIIASAALETSSPKPPEKVAEFFRAFRPLAFAEKVSQSWSSILIARSDSSVSYRHLLKRIRSAPTARLVRAMLPLLATRAFGDKANEQMRSLKRSFTRSPVGVSLSELS